MIAIITISQKDVGCQLAECLLQPRAEICTFYFAFHLVGVGSPF